MISENLFEHILVKDACEGADTLYIVSGYATATMASRHFKELQESQYRSYNLNIQVNLIIGMAIEEGISVSNHIGFKELSTEYHRGNFECSYLLTRPAVHSKAYVWTKQGVPVHAYIGSANYTQTAFFGNKREALEVSNPKQVYDYFHDLQSSSIICSHNDTENLITIVNDRSYVRQRQANQYALFETDLDASPNYSELKSVHLSFLDNTGQLPERSGLNWGHRPEYNRERNQAYIRVPALVARSGFFPPRGRHFTIMTDDGQVIICRIAQDGDKAIESPHNNSIIGLYFRQRMGLPSGCYITIEDLIGYGRTDGVHP